MADSCEKMNIPTILEWEGGVDGTLKILDQTLLPGTEKILECRDKESLHKAISLLSVRGAPLIGIAAAYGVLLGTRVLEKKRNDPSSFQKAFLEVISYLSSSRPTAVNLFWALKRQEKIFFANLDLPFPELLSRLLFSARQIHQEDFEMCKAIGHYGAALLPPQARILTHCNAGKLATGGCGTALGVIYCAVEAGKKIEVYADETRPLLQGARLTAWELQRSGIPVTLLCDNMAGSLMAEGKIDGVIVGADRISAKGDTANKIGTYPLSVLANYHKIPFYVAAPSSTFDLSLSSGKEIPIEHRPAQEVTCWRNQVTAPENIGIYNPAFDVTPASLITAIITEKGVVQPVNQANIQNIVGEKIP